jgi:hypothetical protein
MQTLAPHHAAARTRTPDEEAAIAGLLWTRYGYLGVDTSAARQDWLANRELEDPADRREHRR